MSKTILRFSGMNNVLDAAQIPRDDNRRELSYSVASDILNADPYSTGSARRRRGYRRVVMGAYHSIFNAGQSCYGVMGTSLNRILPSFQTEPVATLTSSNPMRAIDTPIGTIISNGIDIGLVSASGYEPLPTPDPYCIVDEIQVPSYKMELPAGKYLAWFNGILYSLRWENGESWLYHTDGYDLACDIRDNYLRFPGLPTALVAVDDGLYVGAGEKLYFLAGGGPDEFAERRMLDFSVIDGAFTSHRAEDLGLTDRTGLCALFLAQSGFIIGGKGGQITEFGDIEPSLSTSGEVAGAMFVRGERGEIHLVASARGRSTTGNKYEPASVGVKDY